MKDRSLFSWAVLAAGILLIVFYHIGIIYWYQSGNSIYDLAKALKKDWLLLIIVVDAGCFTVICLGWLISDLLKNAGKRNFKWAWLGLAMIFGAPVLLFYLFCERKL